MRPATVQIRQRGTLTLPSKLRSKYRLDDGDTLTLLDLDGSILVTPKLSVVPKLAAEIERLRKSAGLSLDDLLIGSSAPRKRARRSSGRR